MSQLPQHDEKPQLMGGEEPLTQGLQYVASAVKRSSHWECAVSVSIFKPDMTLATQCARIELNAKQPPPYISRHRNTQHILIKS